jgi:medium-chain acyl-[acyl-carrier-protein] hydrolase
MNMNIQTQSNPWLAFARQHTDAPLRMLCFPYAGGGASFYRDWGNDLPALVDILPIQLPGHETRIKEPLISELEPLLDAAIDGLSNVLDRPFVLFGHSMGALVAFEFARRLQLEKGITPAHLIVSGYKAPQYPYQSALRHDLPDDQFITELANLNGTPKEALQSPELMAFMMPTLRADCRVCDLYEYHDTAPLPCPITAYGGSEDPETTRESLQAWDIHTRSDFQSQIFSGGHFFPQTNRHEFITSLSATVTRTLNDLHTG